MAFNFYYRSQAKNLNNTIPETIQPSRKCTFTPESHSVDLPAPPFPKLLHTNYMLSPNQVSLVKEAISVASSVKDNIRSRKELLHNAISRLEDQETELGCYVYKQEALLVRTVVRRIPIDVLGRIFVLALSDTELRFGPNPLSARSRDISQAQIPFTAAQVCQKWRKAAFRQSGLWTHLSLQFDIKWTRDECSAEKLLLLALQRSGQRSLSVNIDIPRDKDNLTNGWPWSVLKGHAKRITHLSINPPYHLFSWSDIKNQIKFPLTTLRIHSPRYHYEKEQSQTDIIAAPPSLRELAIDGSVDLTRFTFPLNGISQLRIVAADLSNVYELLQESPNILELHWKVDTDYSSEVVTILDEPITTSVRRFTIEHDYRQSEEVEDELTKLRFPQLEHLSRIEILMFCNCVDSVASRSLTTLSLVFRTRTSISKSEKEEVPFFKQIKKLLSVLSRMNMDLQNFSLAHGGPWKPNEYLPRSRGSDYRLKPSEDREDIERGYTTLIESMMKKRKNRFLSLRTLSLEYFPLSLSEEILAMVRHKATKMLKEVTLEFDARKRQSVKDITHKIGLVCRDTGLTATVKYKHYYVK